MAVIRTDEGLYVDQSTQAQRVAVVDSSPVTPTERATSITRLTGGADHSIPAGRHSYTVTVIAAPSLSSPTLDGVVLPARYTATYSAPENDTLAAVEITTVAGDDVIVLEIH